MVTINTTDDLLRALAENPRWKEAVRREILTEELLALPARFDSFVATTQAFMDKTEAFMGKTEAFMGKTAADQRQHRRIHRRAEGIQCAYRPAV